MFSDIYSQYPRHVVSLFFTGAGCPVLVTSKKTVLIPGYISWAMMTLPALIATNSASPKALCNCNTTSWFDFDIFVVIESPSAFSHQEKVIGQSIAYRYSYESVLAGTAFLTNAM